MERAAADLKKEFPDVMVMTTTYDHSFGQDSEIQSVDAWCPLTSRFDPERVAGARARGKEVWWYICCGPHHPHANMFIEYPAIEGRLLMGALTTKYRPDGFLYYQISIWNSRKPITGGPFTDWGPAELDELPWRWLLDVRWPRRGYPWRPSAWKTSAMAWKTTPTLAFSKPQSRGWRLRHSCMSAGPSG